MDMNSEDKPVNRLRADDVNFGWICQGLNGLVKGCLASVVKLRRIPVGLLARVCYNATRRLFQQKGKSPLNLEIAKERRSDAEGYV